MQLTIKRSVLAIAATAATCSSLLAGMDTAAPADPTDVRASVVAVDGGHRDTGPDGRDLQRISP